MKKARNKKHKSEPKPHRLRVEGGKQKSNAKGRDAINRVSQESSCRSGEKGNKNPFPFNMSPFPPLAKVTFARGLVSTWIILSKVYTSAK